MIGNLFRMDLPRKKAVAIEIGMQNSGLSTTLAASAFPDLAMATVPGTVVAASAATVAANAGAMAAATSAATVVTTATTVAATSAATVVTAGTASGRTMKFPRIVSKAATTTPKSTSSSSPLSGSSRPSDSEYD